MSGGQGADVFEYNHASESTAGGTDIITDFEIGTDTIDLSDVFAFATTPTFIGANAGFTPFSASSIEIDHVTQNGDDYTEITVKAYNPLFQTTADMTIMLEDHLNLSMSDFVV